MSPNKTREDTTIGFWDIWEQEEGGGGHCYIRIWLLSERKKPWHRLDSLETEGRRN